MLLPLCSIHYFHFYYWMMIIFVFSSLLLLLLDIIIIRLFIIIIITFLLPLPHYYFSIIGHFTLLELFFAADIIFFLEDQREIPLRWPPFTVIVVTHFPLIIILSPFPGWTVIVIGPQPLASLLFKNQLFSFRSPQALATAINRSEYR